MSTFVVIAGQFHFSIRIESSLTEEIYRKEKKSLCLGKKQPKILCKRVIPKFACTSWMIKHFTNVAFPPAAVTAAVNGRIAVPAFPWKSWTSISHCYGCHSGDSLSF